MNLLEFVTTINKIKIVIKLSYPTLINGKIMDEGKIYEIIKAEFNMDYSFHEIAQHILNALQPYCYLVSIMPPKKGFSYYYTASVKK